MKKITKSLMAGLAVLAMQGVASADLSFVPNVPTVDVLFQSSTSEGAQGTGSSQATFGFRNADAAGTDGTRGRGQSFTFATGSGNTYDISSLSVSLGTSADDGGFRPDGQLALSVFEWDSNDPDAFTNWDAGNGADFGAGHVELFNDSFAILSGDTFGNGDLVEIAFDPGELQLTDGTSYGYFFQYTLDSLVDAGGAALNEDVTLVFDVRQDSGIVGALLSTNPAATFATADNAQSTSRDMNFTFTGTTAATVPEPTSIALLGLGALGMVTRRRRS